uniref:Class IV aminotransferase n=1 Tax=Kalanchoe fedtschenkoi TaxID=63787 RepID=A0A7N0V5W4_KALFE
MSSWNLLFRNGAPVRLNSDSIPPVSTFLESHSGAYTTTRTHEGSSRLLFWERHVSRLSNSMKILFESKPEFLFGKAQLNLSSLVESSVWIPVVRRVVEHSADEAMRGAMRRNEGEELVLTTLVSGNVGGLSELKGLDAEERICRCFDVYVHVGVYVPGVFGGLDNCARLAVVGCGRDVAAAKYSDWARLRKPLMKMKPPSATELLLTNDGNHILEGCVTNFFVVCRKDLSEMRRTTFLNHSYEVQTAPICDGVLPGIIRQVVIEVCAVNDIPLQEVAPSWSERESWEEAFVTSSLRVVQHVEKIEVPCSWESLEAQTWSEMSWDVKHFKDGPGIITTLIQNEIMKRASLEGC